jgi:glutathione S-transferase
MRAMKLYYAPKSRATRPRWLLEELGVPYELVRLDLSAKQHRTPEYLAVHPHGLVPAFSDGEVTIFESLAIILHLADRYPEKGLAPAPGSPERARYYQWMAYAVATLEPVVMKISGHAKLSPAEQDAAAMDEQRRKFTDIANVLSRTLEGRDYLLGGFSAADVPIGALLVWARSLGLLEGHPVLQAYTARVSARPAFQRSRAD